MSKERRLGRGLSALLGTDTSEAKPAAAEPEATKSKSPARASTPRTAPAKSESIQPAARTKSPVTTESNEREILLSVSLIEENPFQPRREFGETEIASLAESLKEHDLLQPVLVRRIGNKYQLISGERRLRAARRAGWTKIPAKVRVADDRLVAELAIVENLQRKDLNAIEKALSFKRYLDEHDCTQEDLGKRLKIDRSTIANLLRLLDLPVEVRRALQQGAITQGHARALLPLGDRKTQIQFCKRIGSEGLSVRAIEQLVSEKTRGADGSLSFSDSAAKRKRTRSSQIASMEKDLRRAVGTKVEIKTGAAGKGKFVIHFKNHKEFERIQALLMDDQPKRARSRA